jgi:hypothetical protein
VALALFLFALPGVKAGWSHLDSLRHNHLSSVGLGRWRRSERAGWATWDLVLSHWNLSFAHRRSQGAWHSSHGAPSR